MAWKSLTTRVQDDFKDEVDRIAAENGKTTSDFVRICVEDAVYGHYKLEGEHLVPTEEYLDALTKGMNTVVDQNEEVVNMDEQGDSDYCNLGLDTWVNILRKKEYPNEIIKSLIEPMIYAAHEMPRFDPRKKRGDWGC